VGESRNEGAKALSSKKAEVEESEGEQEND